MFKRALISVSDKTGLVGFLQGLASHGLTDKSFEIISTGGSAQHLRDAGFDVKDVSEVTNFPEILDGRVKTLHPFIHMGVLARMNNEEHRKSLEKFAVKPFDLIICNLYPFEESAQKGLSGMELIEQIDIGGPTVLRAAAKNFETVASLCDPADYDVVLDKGNTLELRKYLSAKVFAHTSFYDSLIAEKLAAESETLTLGFRKKQSLRYGENSQQKADWFFSPLSKFGIHQAEILQGKELSYNNLLDLDASISLCMMFDEPVAVAVKHNNPCGVAAGSTPLAAVQKALAADPQSVFGGIIAVNSEVDEAQAIEFQKIFLECIIAPSFTKGALDHFGKKKNLRLLAWPQMKKNKDEVRALFAASQATKSILGGLLTQSQNTSFSNDKSLKFLSAKPAENILQDMFFGEKVGAALKSNAIAIVYNQQTIGLGMGQVNRVDAVEQAIQRWQKFFPDVVKDVVLVSDAFFPFADSIEAIAAAGIKYILQPGGSVKDEEVFQKAQELGVNMVISGLRHFKH